MGREFSQEDDSDENSDEAPGCQPLMKSISGILQSPAFRSLAMKQLHRYHLAMAVAATSSMTRGLSTDAKLQMQLGPQVFTCSTFREICWSKTM